MTQADRVHSTPPTNTSADHQFLSTAAGIGGAVMTIERPMFPPREIETYEPFATPDSFARRWCALSASDRVGASSSL